MTLPETPWIHTLRFALEIAATAAFALSGMIAAARKRMDVVGVCTVACFAAFGGGTLRDLMLDQRPFFWVRHTGYVWGIMALCVAAMLFMRQRHFKPTERAMLLPDTIGLGLFTAVGVDVAMTADMPALIAVVMGVVTSVFGGVLRDVLCNQIPAVFRDHRPYALCAFAGAWVWLAASVSAAREAVTLSSTSFSTPSKALLVRPKRVSMLALWAARICSVVSDMSYLLKMVPGESQGVTDICADH